MLSLEPRVGAAVGGEKSLCCGANLGDGGNKGKAHVLSSAEPRVGVARWVLRIACGANLGDGGNKGKPPPCLEIKTTVTFSALMASLAMTSPPATKCAMGRRVLIYIYALSTCQGG
jgi:hypothetical protein